MSIQYGGGPKAFLRLQEVLPEKNTRRVLFAWRKKDLKEKTHMAFSLTGLTISKLPGLLPLSPRSNILSHPIV